MREVQNNKQLLERDRELENTQQPLERNWRVSEEGANH